VMRRQALYQRPLRSLSTAWKLSGRTQDLSEVSTELRRPVRQKVSCPTLASTALSRPVFSLRQFLQGTRLLTAN
jgi:hypothetical protein